MVQASPKKNPTMFRTKADTRLLYTAVLSPRLAAERIYTKKNINNNINNIIVTLSYLLM